MKPEKTPESALSSLHSALSASVEAYNDCVRRVTEDLKGPKYDSKLGSHLIYLMEGGAKVLGQLRLLELSAKQVVEDMNADEQEELLHALVEEMQPGRFKKFKAWVNALEEGA